VQLVVTLPNAPSGDVAAQLNALWRKIAAFGNHLAGLSFAQIKARIEDFERQILAIVRPLAASASASTATAANTGSASPGVSAAPGPAESAGASTSALPSASSTAPASASVAPPASTAPTPSTTAPSSAAVVTP
jgi:hypothetical protein